MKRLTYLCLLCTLAISSVAHAATLRTVALTGQQAPGTPDGVNLVGFGNSNEIGPALNDSGQTAFLSYVVGGGAATQASGRKALAVWRWWPARGARRPGCPAE